MHGILHNFRLKERLDYECTNLAKFIAPAVLTKGTHTKSSCLNSWGRKKKLAKWKTWNDPFLLQIALISNCSSAFSKNNSISKKMTCTQWKVYASTIEVRTNNSTQRNNLNCGPFLLEIAFISNYSSIFSNNYSIRLKSTFTQEKVCASTVDVRTNNSA